MPATVKCRIGVDDQDPEESLFRLVDACAAAGVSTFVVHARKAWLKGLSPKENREIPPLDYRAGLSAEGRTAGADRSSSTAASLAWTRPRRIWRHVDGVMLGRAAYHEPGLLGAVDRRLFDPAAADVDGFEAVERYRAAHRARTGVAERG